MHSGLIGVPLNFFASISVNYERFAYVRRHFGRIRQKYHLKEEAKRSAKDNLKLS